jgi:S1-C subfamily serine protease
MAGLNMLPNTRNRCFCLLHFALCLLTCFSFFVDAAPQAPAPQTPPLSGDRVLPSVVQLLAVGPADHEQNQECSATGFLINEDGYLITSWHVVEAARGCLAKAPGAKILVKRAVSDARTAQAVPCNLVAFDENNDLAIMKLERPFPALPGGKPAFAVLDARAVPVGAAVWVSGHPAFAWQPVTQAGHVVWIGKTGLEEMGAPPSRPSDALMVDIHLRPGNSGSPLYRPEGGVVAVIDKRDSLRPDYSIAVAIHYAIELAERNGVRWYASATE